MARIRVLVADDNKAIREILVSILSMKFDVVRAVSDGGSALTAAVQLLPDVAVLDIAMPVLNGIDVARRIKGLCKMIAIVFVTACMDRDVFDAATDVGSYVLKPRMCTDLVPAINLALSGERFVSPGLP